MKGSLKPFWPGSMEVIKIVLCFEGFLLGKNEYYNLFGVGRGLGLLGGCRGIFWG